MQKTEIDIEYRKQNIKEGNIDLKDFKSITEDVINFQDLKLKNHEINKAIFNIKIFLQHIKEALDGNILDGNIDEKYKVENFASRIEEVLNGNTDPNDPFCLFLQDKNYSREDYDDIFNKFPQNIRTVYLQGNDLENDDLARMMKNNFPNAQRINLSKNEGITTQLDPYRLAKSLPDLESIVFRNRLYFKKGAKWMMKDFNNLNYGEEKEVNIKSKLYYYGNHESAKHINFKNMNDDGQKHSTGITQDIKEKKPKQPELNRDEKNINR